MSLIDKNIIFIKKEHNIYQLKLVIIKCFWDWV